MKNIRELVRSRRSFRTYDGRELSPEDKEKLLAFGAEIENPYGIPLEFKLMEAKEHGLSCPVVTGTELYLGGKIKNVPYMEEAFGYSFEKLVLYAQSLGIGTVWLGGTMNRGAFEQAMELKDGEKMPCATPLGYPSKKLSIKETMMRKAIKADSRKPFPELFFAGSFDCPLKEEEAGIWAYPLEMVRWAPSAVNKQPWRVVIDGNTAHFYLKRSKGFSSTGAGDMQKIDMGIALCHFALAAREQGLSINFAINDPNLNTGSDTEYIASYTLAE